MYSLEWHICVPIRSCGTISNFVQHQALSMLYQKCWINISYQSKVVVAYGLLSSINKTHAWIELPWLENFLHASKFVSLVKIEIKEFFTRTHTNATYGTTRSRLHESIESANKFSTYSLTYINILNQFFKMVCCSNASNSI